MGFLWGSTPEQDQMSIALGSSLLGGRNVQEQFAGVAPAMVPFMAKQAENKQAEKVRQSTLQMLQAQDSDLAQAVQANAMTPAEAVKMSFERRAAAQKAQAPKMSFQKLEDGTYGFADETSGTFKPLGKSDASAQNRVKRGLNPVWGKDAQGNTVLGTLGEDGSFLPVDLPEGFKPTPGTSTIDLGTSVGVRDNKTGEIINTLPKDIAGAEIQKELGAAEGKNIASAPGDLQAGLNAKDLIEELKTDPNREWGTGWSSITGMIPGTPAYDYQTKVNQAKSGAFLTAIQQMRGLGALSNAEGSAATAAVTRMDAATSEPEFLDALADYEKIVDQGIERAKSRLPTKPEQTTSSGVNTTSSGVKWKVPGQ